MRRLATQKRQTSEVQSFFGCRFAIPLFVNIQPQDCLLGRLLYSASILRSLGLPHAGSEHPVLPVISPLGAQRGAVLQLVISDGMKLVGCGIVLGLGASLVLGRALSHMLFGISSADPASLASTGVTLIAVALAACYVPARSATRIDPMNALREN